MANRGNELQALKQQRSVNTCWMLFPHAQILIHRKTVLTNWTMCFTTVLGSFNIGECALCMVRVCIVAPALCAASIMLYKTC